MHTQTGISSPHDCLRCVRYCTSTRPKIFTGLKRKAKTPFYGRAAAAEVLAELILRTFTDPPAPRATLCERDMATRHAHRHDAGYADVDDDFDTDEGLTAAEAEHEAVAQAAMAAGVPPRRSPRAGLAATTAAIDTTLAKERER